MSVGPPAGASACDNVRRGIDGRQRAGRRMRDLCPALLCRQTLLCLSLFLGGNELKFDDQQHPLLWQARQSHTTDWGHCGCGSWALWEPTKEAIQVAHQKHLEEVQQRASTTQPTAAPPNTSDLHELRWTGGGGYFIGY